MQVRVCVANGWFGQENTLFHILRHGGMVNDCCVLTVLCFMMVSRIES